MSVYRAVTGGNTKESLEAVRDELARAIDAGPPARDLAAL